MGEFLASVIPFVFIAYVVISSMIFLKDRAFVKLAINLVVIVAIATVLFITGILGGEPRESGQSSGNNAEPAPEPEPEPAPEPAEPVDWTPLVFGLGALLTVGAIGGGGFVTYQGVKASKTARRKKLEEAEKQATKKKETIRRWDNMRATYQDVVSRYAEYETDIWKSLKYPALHNVEVEKTSDFLKQLRVVNNALKEQEYTDKGTIGGTDELHQQLSREVNLLENLFELAEKNALRMEWKTLPSDEKKDLKQAVQLLKHAESEGNSSEARQTYYEQLQKVVDRLNSRHVDDIIPTAIVKTLASGKETLLLTDGNTSDESLNIDNFLNAQKEVVEDTYEVKPSMFTKVSFKNRFQKTK